MLFSLTGFRRVLLAIILLQITHCKAQVQTVAVSSVLQSPYLMTAGESNKSEYSGFIKDLLDKVSQHADVKFVIHLSAEYGKELENGSWTGLVGDILNKKVDMAAAPLTITYSRRKVVDFSVSFENFGPVIILRRPSNPQPTFEERVSRLFAPLGHSVWLMSLVAYFTTSVVLYIICHCNPYEWRHLHRDGLANVREAESFTCMNAFWFMLSTWMWQGYMHAPRSLGGRLVVAFWWLFVIIFLLTYTANLTNLLRIGPTPIEDQQYSRIVGLESLVKQTDVDFGYLRGGSTEAYFKNAQMPSLRRVWENVEQKKSSTDDVSAGVNRVRNSSEARPFAFIMESAMAKYMLRQKPCDLYMVGDLTITGAYAFAYRPGWHLAEQMDMALLKLRENGEIKQLEDKWFSGHCDASVLDPAFGDRIKDSPFYAVDLGSFSGALVILAAGVFSGGLVTIIEIIIFRKAELIPDEAAQPMKTKKKNKSKNKSTISDQMADRENVTDV